ncbi:MAG: DUF3108 domain-containing protein [Betaproteobacteria bacterium]
MKLIIALLIFASAGSSAFAAQSAVPTRIEIKYKVSLGSMSIGEGLDVFQHDAKTYSVVSESKTSGVAAMLYKLNIQREAKGTITAEGLRPDSFVESRNGQVKRSATFDWNANQIELNDSGTKQTVALPPHTWDATSFAWNFAFAPPEGKEIKINVTDGRRVTDYKYAVLGHEKLATPLGEMDTLHVRKVQDEGDKRAFDVWLAVDKHYAPVRIRATEKDGSAFDSLVESITLSPR